MLHSPQSFDDLLLVPGQRIDVLIRGERNAGSYRILDLPYDRGSMEMMGGPMMARGGTMRGMGQASGPEPIASITYQGRSERNWNVPARLVDVPALAPPTAPSRTFELAMGMMMGRGMDFTINGRTFAADRIDTAVHLNSVEDWEFVNSTMMDHPMHLHTNAFQILDAQGQPERAWRDVVIVKAKSSARLRVRFTDFAGKAVQHCHILDHEDMGMMSTVQMNE
ncbi:MAG: multicopper oxidase domain-containing protein [Chloroflexi bacterium]|nr:multicopper oxidase domain-containing protein [Chloroflexota bacterium]